MSPKTTFNIKLVCAMKKLQALYNNDTNNIVKEPSQEKSAYENQNFWTDMAMVVSNTKPTVDEPQAYQEAWSHPNVESCRK